MAFYFTKAFGEERWAIHWYAPVRGHELARRRDLLLREAGVEYVASSFGRC